MRIALLTTEYPTEASFAGGLASYLRRLALALNGAGHDAEVFTLSERREEIFDGAVRVHRIAPAPPPRAPLRRMPGFAAAADYAETARPAWKLAAALHRRHREAPFDAVQASSFRACGLIAALRQQIPVVTRISSYEPLWRKFYQRPLTARQRRLESAERWQLCSSAALYAPSRLLAETVKREEGFEVAVIEPPFEISPPPAGLPDAAPALAPQGYALFFGSLGYLKGCDRLIRVLPGLLERNSDLKFLFAGPPRWVGGKLFFDALIRRELRDFIDRRVFILPAQRPAALLQLVQNARFVVLPSKIDNLPNACLEALALGRVVVASRGASFEQLIDDGVNGFLAAQDNDAELAARMEHAWRLPLAERSRIGAAAARSIERFAPARTIGPLLELFGEAARRRWQTLRRLAPALK